MRLDIKRAFLSPFSDERWKSKLFILSLFTVILNLPLYFLAIKFTDLILLLILFLSTIFLFCIALGYCAQFAHNEIHNILSLLPDWRSSLLKYFKYGLFSSIIFFIYIIPFLIVFSLMDIFKESVVLSLFRMLFYFLALMIILFGINLYWDNHKISEAFAINKLFKFVSRAKIELITVTLVFTIFYYLSDSIAFHFPQNVIADIACVFIIPLQMLIATNLFAQAYKKARYL